MSLSEIASLDSSATSSREGSLAGEIGPDTEEGGVGMPRDIWSRKIPISVLASASASATFLHDCSS